MTGNLVQNKWLFVIFVTGLLLGLIVTGCMTASNSETSTDKSSSTPSDSNESESDNKRYGGTLKLISGADVGILGLTGDIRSRNEYIISSAALEQLGAYDEQGNMIPVLAESWDMNAEEKTITVYIKEGIKFHDGTDFNAEAVKWNLETFKEAGRIEARELESVEVIDEYTVQLHLSPWNQTLLELVWTMAPMISPSAVKENGTEWAKDHPVGTGPFVFDEWVKGESVTFTRNEDYWQEGKPYLDAIEWNIIQDSSTAEAAMIAGDFDVYYQAPSLVANNLSSSFVVVPHEIGNGAMGLALAPDSANPESPFADERVRKAVGHAIDRQSIIDTIYYGYGTPTNQWSIPDFWSYNSEVDQAYDPDKARQLLEQAGYAEGFSTELTYDTRQPEDTFTAIQGYLAEVGVDVHLNGVPTGTWQEMTSSDGSWDGLINVSFMLRGEMASGLTRILSDDGSVYSQIHWPEEFDPLLERARNVTSDEENVEVAMEIQQKLFGENAIMIPLFTETMTTVKHEKVKDDRIYQTWPANWTPQDVWIDE